MNVVRSLLVLACRASTGPGFRVGCSRTGKREQFGYPRSDGKRINPEQLRVRGADRHVENEEAVDKHLERADVPFDLLRES